MTEPIEGGVWRGRAHAKVNLRLCVLAREASGYHQLETVFQRLELADEVELEPGDPGGPPGVTLEVTGVSEGALGPVESNLAVRAVHAWARGRGEAEARVHIRLRKRIPHGAGLGGGSSDAAAVLLGMNALHGDPLTVSELAAIGGGLGSDVPFFVSGASRAFAWGRGDRILPLEPLPSRPVLLAVPAKGISTPWAYGVLAEARARGQVEGVSSGVLDLALAGGWEAVAEAARNDFEAVLFPLRPELETTRIVLAEEGASPALLSGSGAAVFGVFREEGDRERAEHRLEKAVPGVRLLRTLTDG